MVKTSKEIVESLKALHEMSLMDSHLIEKMFLEDRSLYNVL